jgi:DNA polymerase-1
MSEKLLLIDAYSQIYRAFFAIRKLNAPDGQPVNAIFGFTKMLLKMTRDHAPTHLGVVFDLGAPEARLTIQPTYKAQRPPTPPELASQLPVIREMLTALRAPILESEGQEADDIIATLSVKAAADNAQVLIASSDKDFAQLVSENISLLRADTKGDTVWVSSKVVERFGINPDQFVDYLSLIGDSVDNIPGVPGVGEKTAAQLLRENGSLEGILARLDKISKPKLRESLTANANLALRNRTLIRLKADLPLPFTWQTLRTSQPDYPKAATICRQLGFKSLTAEFEALCSSPPDMFL